MPPATARRARLTLHLMVAALVVATSLALPAVASAHAGLIAVDPADGQKLETSPPMVTIEFNESIGIGPDAVRVVDQAGQPVELEAATAAGSRVSQKLPALADGWYLVTWTVVSADGHVVHGASSFAVGNASGPPPTVTAVDPTPLAIALARAIGDLGLVVTTGVVGAILLLGGASPRTRRLGFAAGLVGAAGALALAGLTYLDAGLAALSGALLPVVALRAALLVVAAVAVRIGRDRLAGAAAALALVTEVVGGHPGTAPLTAILFLTHLSAGALWLGAAPAVLLVLVDRGIADGDAERVVRRFSRLATVTLLLVAIGGAALAVLLTDALTNGIDPRYGVLLGAKILLVALAALLGALTRRRLARGPVDRARLRRLFTVDATLLIVVVLLSAGLTTGSPIPADAGDDSIHVGHCSPELTTGTASLSLVPARVGDNDVYLDAAGTVARASLELRRADDPGAITIDLAPRSGSLAGSGVVPVEGVWDATVIVGRDEFSEERASCQLRVLP